MSVKVSYLLALSAKKQLLQLLGFIIHILTGKATGSYIVTAFIFLTFLCRNFRICIFSTEFLRKKKSQCLKPIQFNRRFRKDPVGYRREVIRVCVVECDSDKIMEYLKQEVKEDGLAEGKMENQLSSVQAIMKNLNMTPIQAMDVLNILEEERGNLLEQVNG